MPTLQTPVKIYPLSLPSAAGKIDTDSRIVAGEFSTAELNEFLSRLEQFYTPLNAAKAAVPTQCVDGRSRVDGSYEPAAKAAGGTFSAVVGDALTTASFRPADGNAADHARQVYGYLLQHGYAVGGHDADHAVENGCGCGAEDNLETILQFIQAYGDGIYEFLQNIHVSVPTETHTSIVARANELIGSAYISTGAELRQALISIGGNKSIETLTGAHHEVVLVINTKPNTTIDRAALVRAYGDTLQLFELDVPSLQTAADALSLTSVEASQKFTAMLYYNVATAAVLAGPSLRIAVR